MTKKIIPAILPKDFIDLKDHLDRIKGVSDFVQIDICNGTYTPSKTWPFTHTPDIYFEGISNQEEGMPYWQDIDFEFDLMIDNPEAIYKKFLAAGPARMIFHFETLKEPYDFLKKVKEASFVEIGIAFSNDTKAIEHKDVIELADIVQCMGISKIGYQGQEFDERVINQIKEIRAEFPDKLIAVDGSVNEETISELSDAGVNNFITGSAFFETDNLIETKKFFESLV